MVIRKIFNLSNLTLLTALILSGIAAWYSILGLTAIFAAAVMPIIIMGGSLEVAKVVTTVWLHRYWDKISWQLKIYLVPAVVALAFMTSMGIFGFLSKAHMDQGVPSGDIAAKVALIDEKIKTQKENIKASREALAQMDSQVNNVMNKGDTEQSAARSVQIRRQQQAERAKLQSEIEAANAQIGKLNEERVPIASQLRKVEAEVGPIKYIAALIYGDNPDQNVLERAVRWVIILIVAVFDPLALTLVIASNTSRAWEVYEEPVEEKKEKGDSPVGAEKVLPTTVTDISDNDPNWVDPPSLAEECEIEEPKEESVLASHPYLFKPFVHFKNLSPVIYKEAEVNEPSEKEPDAIEAEVAEIPELPEIVIPKEIVTEGVTVEEELPYKEVGDGYVKYEGKLIKKDALRQLKPELFLGSHYKSDSSFGEDFPKFAKRGDTFVRVDMLPNRVFKFDGTRWFEVSKDDSDSYLANQEYVQYLIGKIESGEYDIELLSDVERELIEEYLRNQNS